MGGPNYIPFLATDFGLWVEKDIETYGALMTTSDPAKGVGGGAILIGHGLDGANDPPHIQLTDYAINSDFGTLYIYKLDSNWNRLHGDLDIGDLTAHGTRLGLSDEANFLNKKPNYYAFINNPLTVPTGGVFFGGNLGGSSPGWGCFIQGVHRRIIHPNKHWFRC